MRFVSIGHVTKDEIPGGWRPGGSAYYGAAAAAKLGLDATVITRVGTNELEAFERACGALGVRLLALPSPVTTTFAAGRRRGGAGAWRIVARAPGIAARDVSAALEGAGLSVPVGAEALLLGCVAREIAPDVLEAFRGGARVLAAQGFLREWDVLGQIGPRLWAEPELFLDGVDAVVVSEDDLEGQPETAGEWSRQVPVLVTRAAKGASLWRNEAVVEVAGFPRRAVDPVGAGDTFAASLAIAIAEGRSLIEATRFANAVASCKVEGIGTDALPDHAAAEARLRG